METNPDHSFARYIDCRADRTACTGLHRPAEFLVQYYTGRATAIRPTSHTTFHGKQAYYGPIQNELVNF